jgi:Uma2 family endonuclease
MTTSAPQLPTLVEFLQLPYIEDSPAWEFVQGQAIQKPMPGGKRSRLQSRIAGRINGAGSDFEAFPALRCTFSGRSIVPDVVVLSSEKVPVDEEGEIATSGIEIAPDWVIEILSPKQSQMNVTRKILHSLRHGTQLGWLIDPEDRVVLVFRPDTLPEEQTGDVVLPVLSSLNLSITVAQVFDWLKVGNAG